MQNDKIYTIEEIKSILSEHNEFFESRYFVKNFLLFGSYAKNQQTLNSDIDLLVNFKQPIDFLNLLTYKIIFPIYLTKK